jgi:hypothetical protein
LNFVKPAWRSAGQTLRLISAFTWRQLKSTWLGERSPISSSLPFVQLPESLCNSHGFSTLVNSLNFASPCSYGTGLNIRIMLGLTTSAAWATEASPGLSQRMNLRAFPALRPDGRINVLAE